MECESSETTRKAPRTVDSVFRDHCGRRRGLLKALTTENELLLERMDPEGDNLSLYSYPNETWNASKPPERIPSDLPEPCLGVNFARVGMDPKEWLSLVAAHSDAWLMAVAFFRAKKFSKIQRAELFERINNLATLFEVVQGQASPRKTGRARSSATTSKPDIIREEVQEDVTDEADDEELCGVCDGSYSSSRSQFWICCDFCLLWFHGKCAKITRAEADKINKYKCLYCVKKKKSRGPRQGKRFS